MTEYPPADDRLKHLLAQEINTSVDTWKLAFWIADGIVKDPAIRRELERIATAHTAGESCGDRHCQHCWNARLSEQQPEACAEYVGVSTQCARCDTPLETHPAPAVSGEGR